jgi:putative spermidine/putrescine transport system ATP-binding protein
MAGAMRTSDATTDGHALRLDRLTKRYGEVTAVDDVSLAIKQGQFFSLLGPSGSGKTTILMMIAGFVDPTEGAVWLGERDITHLLPERRNFGMVFQGYALFPNLTVAENIGFPLTVRRMASAETARRVRDALDMVQLSGMGDRYPKQLSGGQQQRVALARALVFEPTVLLLDEPLSALDKKLRTGLQWELRELHRRIGKTFVCVTHDQEEALSLSDEIAILRDGRVVQSGRPDALFDQPASHFIADFLGESNFLEAKVVGLEGDLMVCAIGETILRQSRPPAPPSVSESCLIALRPFKIELHEHEPMTKANRLPGAIRRWSYRGDETHCAVETAIGNLTVRCPTWESRVQPRDDARVWVAWDPSAAVTVQDDRPGAASRNAMHR